MAEKVTRAGAAAIELLKKERDELREMLHTAHKHARGDSDFIINEQAKNRELQAEVARLKKEAGEWDIERNNEHSRACVAEDEAAELRAKLGRVESCLRLWSGADSKWTVESCVKAIRAALEVES